MTQYDSIGQSYIEGQRGFFSKREDWARTFIPQSMPECLTGKRVLDLGCGHGVDLVRYQEMGARVFGVDESQLMVDEAKKVATHPDQILCTSMETLSCFSSRYFDYVVGRFSVHYLPSLEKMYLEAHRVLVEGGELIYVAHHPFADLLHSRHKVYGEQEEVSVPLYNGKVTITFPTHTLKDFLSPTFCQLFRLTAVLEYSETGQEIFGVTAPSALGIRAVRM